MSEGLIYTSFAMLAAIVLVSLASLPVGQTAEISMGESTRIGEASFFLDSVMEDLDRSLGIATRRALIGATNYVLDTGQPLESPSDNITSALVNGTISGVELNSTENATLVDWKDRVRKIAARPGYELEMTLENYTVNASGFDIESSYEISARLYDPITRASFNRSETAETTVSVEGVEDTMILLRSKGRYISKYSYCGFDTPAEIVGEGDYYSGTVFHGRAAVNPVDASTVPDQAGKILAVDDIDSYSSSTTSEFGAVVSAQPNSSTGYNDNYVYDLDGRSQIEQLEDNMSVIVEERRVWNSRFREMFLDGCYVESGSAPDVVERFENNISESDSGLVTLIDISRLPAELQEEGSAVGYVYFSEDDFGQLQQIEGVSGDYSWFRLDQEHVDRWNLQELVE